MQLFGTAGIRGSVDEVTPELAAEVGRAAALAAGGEVFLVGRDGRTTGGALAAAAAAGLQSGGTAVRHAGVAPTPALASASSDRDCHALVATASHNLPADNGIKLFDRGVEYDRDTERAVAGHVDGGSEPIEWSAWGGSRNVEVVGSHRRAVLDYVTGRFGRAEGVAVVVDSGNGTAGPVTPRLLRGLGAEVTALSANVDGHFPARESKPTADSLADCRAFLARSDAAVGIAHDGDADRTVVLDGDGEVVHEDTVVAILAERYVRDSDAADPVVVTTPNASGRIDERVGAAGGRVERVRLGGLHEGIAGVEAGDGTVAFAAEPWKHIHPAFGGWIDGVVSAAAITALVADRGLDALRDPVTERPYRKTSVECPEARKAATMDRLRVSLSERFPDADLDTEHGIRADLPDGSWVLVRPSGTEPCIRVYAESDHVEDLVSRTVAAVEAAVEEQ